MQRIKHLNSRAAVAAGAAAVIAVTTIAAQAGETGTRTKKYTYQGGCGVSVQVSGNGVSGTPSQCVLGADYGLKRKSTEKYLSITVTDSTGQAVPGEIWLSGGVGNAQSVPFCGSLKNYKMTQTTYRLDLNMGVNTDCPGEPTSGTITVTYSATKV